MAQPHQPGGPVLAEGWDANAETWVEWTRQGLDSYSAHKLSFLPLIPEPGQLTVDIGAGEGRVSRELLARGHRVVAVDYSFAMTKAASTHPEVPVPAVVADAGRLPLRTASADCAVAFMCLHDMDDLTAVLTEASRVLQIGGRLVLALVHPLNSAGAFDRTDSSSTPAYVIHDAYTEERHYTDVRTRNGLSMTYNGIHRPLHAYTTALSCAGFSIQQLREISSDEPDNKWSRVPLFLHMVAIRLA